MANDQLNANLDSISKAMDIHIKYEAHIMKMRRDAIENAKQELELVSDVETYRTKVWSINNMKTLYRAYDKNMQRVRLRLGAIMKAFARMSMVDTLEHPAQMWAGFNFVRPYLTMDWKLEKLPNGMARILFIDQCRKYLPEVGSEDHLELMRCMGACGVVLQTLFADQELELEKLLKGQIDIWQEADWTLK